MNESGQLPQKRSEVFVLGTSILAFWVIALVVWWAALWHADAYADIAADFPRSTILFISSTRAGLPFMLSALFSAVVIYQFRRSAHRPTVVVAWLLCACIAYSSFAMIAMTSPMLKMCGELVPSWPTTVEQRGDSTGGESLANESSDGCVP